MIIGFITSFVVGFQDPREIDWNLLSPPIRDFLFSLSNRTKEKFNIPLKLIGKNTKKIVGVTNMGLEMNEENYQNKEEKSKTKKEIV